MSLSGIVVSSEVAILNAETIAPEGKMSYCGLLSWYRYKINQVGSGGAVLPGFGGLFGSGTYVLSTSSEPSVYPPPEKAFDPRAPALSGSGSRGRSRSARAKRSRMRLRPGTSLSGFWTLIPLRDRKVSSQWEITIKRTGYLLSPPAK